MDITYDCSCQSGYEGIHCEDGKARGTDSWKYWGGKNDSVFQNRWVGIYILVKFMFLSEISHKSQLCDIHYI